MSSNAVVVAMNENDIVDWDFLPPELLRMIFKYLDYKSLVFCMSVNRRWKDIAEDYIEFYSLWRNIVRQELVNSGITYQIKSTLNWKNLLINSNLWSSVCYAWIEHHHTYKLRNVITIHMYRDTLIVKMKGMIKYFNIRNFNMTRHYKSEDKEVDFTENDSMIVYLTQEEIEGDLCLYGKVETDQLEEDFSFNENLVYHIDDVLLFRLEDNICYIVTNTYVVWAYIWKGNMWEFKLLGRYYGNSYDRVHALHVFDNTVYMITKNGLVLNGDEKSKLFQIIFRHNVLLDKMPTNWTLFHKHGAAVAVKSGDQRITVRKDDKTEATAWECIDMTCATEHGDVIFLGFKDGTVAICSVSNMLRNNGMPELMLRVQDYDKKIKDPTVLALEVFEDYLCHHLFIATRYQVIQLLITYPGSITTYYD